MQGGILKATTSTRSHPKPVGDQQAGSGRIPGSSRSKFNGKKVSNHHSRTGTAITLDDGRRIEDAFWQKKPLQGRPINTADVLNAYGKDKTSFRSGCFLQQLCLQNMRHGNIKVTPDHVVRELSRMPGRNDKCQTAIARFKEECCLTGLRLDGRLVTPDMVIKDFPESRQGKLGMARFKEHCCLKGLSLRGQKIAPDTVVKDFQAINATLELARFQAECCLRGLPLNGQPVTPEAVIRAFPDNLMGKLGLARFKEQCCQKGLALNGQQITADEVVKGFPDSPQGQLALARFKADCCLTGKMMNGQPVTPDEVAKAFPASHEGKLGLAHFKETCCLTELLLNGRRVRPEAVVKGFQAVNATLKLSYFKKECCLRGLTLNGQQVAPDEVVREFQAAKATMSLAHFKMECCLRGLMLHGQQVLPESVVKDYRAANAPLGLARFKEKCCLRGVALNGQQVTPDEVVNDYQVAKAEAEQARCNAEARLKGLSMNDQQVEYQATKATLELARFRAECCLRGWSLNGQQVIPVAVVKGFQAINAPLELARFKENCCLKALAVNGRPVTTEEVVKGYKDAKAPLELARFKAECCLRGLALNGQQVTTDEVVKDFKSAKAPLELGRFKADCCLLGLLLHGQLVTPDEVARDFPDSREGRLGLGRFKADCCLKGLVLHGRKVTPDEVVKGFPDSPEGRLAIARFMEMCCLMELPLNGQQVTPDAVVKSFPSSSDGRIGLARFKEQCCFGGLMLQGHQVVPDEVVSDFPNNREGKLARVRFQGACCLRGLALNRRQVTPDAVVKDFKRGGWLLESAIFQTRLALNARELNGSYLDNAQVLAAFNEAPGDHACRQAEFLMHRLKQHQWFDETNEAQEIIQQAWQILNSAPVKDEQHRLQCILKFMAMQHELSIDQQRVSAEEVLQSMKTLRNSFKNKRTHFFFLAHCYIKRQTVDGQTIRRDHVLECLQGFPERSKLRHALGHWFARFSPEANIMNEFLFQQERAAAPRRNSPHRTAVPATQTVATSAAQVPKQWSIEPGFLNRHPQFNALTLQTLEIIQEINGSYRNPPILITGSYARFLQNRCSSFNDIDIICTAAEPARTLFDRLQALNSDKASEIPKNIVIWDVPGCPEIQLPKAYNIHLKDGDLGMKAMGIQVSIDARVTDGNASRCAVQVPGVERLVWCLSFAEETRLLNNTLEYLATNLDPLTRKLQKGEVFYLPRTILFNTPENPGEYIYGLLMRSLLSLHKARQFIDLHSEDRPGTPIQNKLLQEQRQQLYMLTANLQTKLSGHVCRSDFEHRVNNWLSTTHHVNEYEFKRRDFITALLAMMQSE
ncbi:hypothetical protein [Endozoicomonas sp. ALC013]|uniref:hypothetical protein n=1 Tax=Endozoicomonas sp. ALC013 TaxID=3403076 RepID=UPI003BB55591